MEFPLEYYDYSKIPTGRDMYVVSEDHYPDFIKFWRYYLDDPNPKVTHPNWLITTVRASVLKVNQNFLVIEVFLDTSFRFHSAVVTLAKEDLVYCLENYNYQKQPILIVTKKWFKKILSASYSTFCMVDAIGVKSSILKDGEIKQDLIRKFTKGVDKISRRYRDYTLFSFGDSVVIKGTFKGDRKYFYTYKPEELLCIAKEVSLLFKTVFGYDSYAICSQGFLYDFEKKGVKKYLFGNHYSLGSLGTPFVEIFEIDEAARKNIKSKTHKPSELYMTDYFYHTLDLELDNKNTFMKYSYASKMSFIGSGDYYVAMYEDLFDKLKQMSVKDRSRILRFRFKYWLEEAFRWIFHKVKVELKYKKSEMYEMIKRGPTKEAD